MPRRNQPRRRKPRNQAPGPGLPKGKKRPRSYHHSQNIDAVFRRAMGLLEGGGNV
jgi:hypothetical protein